MKLTLTDIHTGRQMKVLYENTLLPALGEDGLQYFIFSTVTHNGQPRTDCTVVDMTHKLAISPVKYPYKGIDRVEFIFDKETFEKADSIPEYTRLLREKKII
jgi:hypothetical protein